MKLLDSELSNREIAGRLFISLDTVKSHTRHIYAKLGVRARHQAVARQRVEAAVAVVVNIDLAYANPTVSPLAPSSRPRPCCPGGCRLQGSERSTARTGLASASSRARGSEINL